MLPASCVYLYYVSKVANVADNVISNLPTAPVRDSDPTEPTGENNKRQTERLRLRHHRRTEHQSGSSGEAYI